jgi:AmiR/NasT family two-component response regulator
MDDEGRQLEEQLRASVESRTVIGMALGILMERYEVDQQQAFAHLRRASSWENRKLADIAQELVSTRSMPQARDAS